MKSRALLDGECLTYETTLYVVGRATRYPLEGPGIESSCGDILRLRPDRPWGPPRFLYNGTGSLSLV
jgi:hypothetical protein